MASRKQFCVSLVELLNSHDPFSQFMLSGAVLHLSRNETLRIN